MSSENNSMIRVYYTKPTASGGRKGWAKIVTGIDETKDYGYQFEGDFLRDGEQDLPEDTVIVEQVPDGSVKNNWKRWQIILVKGVGLNGLSWVQDKNWIDGKPTFGDRDYAAWWKSDMFLSYRDRVKELVERDEFHTEPPMSDTEIDHILTAVDHLDNVGSAKIFNIRQMLMKEVKLEEGKSK